MRIYIYAVTAPELFTALQLEREIAKAAIHCPGLQIAQPTVWVVVREEYSPSLNPHLSVRFNVSCDVDEVVDSKYMIELVERNLT
jgi:hypothetical protein